MGTLSHVGGTACIRAQKIALASMTRVAWTKFERERLNINSKALVSFQPRTKGTYRAGAASLGGDYYSVEACELAVLSDLFGAASRAAS
jgi:hypothetical protein